MRARRTEHTDKVFRLPGGTEDNDLWTYTMLGDPGVPNGEPIPIVASVWVPTDEERERIAAGENIRLLVWGGGMPPVALDLTDEEVRGAERAG